MLIGYFNPRKILIVPLQLSVSINLGTVILTVSQAVALEIERKVIKGVVSKGGFVFGFKITV
jgi:hypothetical protein